MTIRRILPLAACCLLATTGTVNAQESAYADHTNRRIKALSPEEIASLETGAGMGMALAAELNGYPGPKHVLELADDLELTEEQRRQTQAMFETMQAGAIQIGAEIILEEAQLDSLFTAGTITESALEDFIARIAESHGKLRAVHLRTHLTMRALLSDHQAGLYNALRGYGGHTGH